MIYFICISQLFILCVLNHFLLTYSFTCQGTSYKNCPDGGSQKLSSGGNVTVYLRRAENLPNRDATISASVSDPYVEFYVGSNLRKVSSTIMNDLNPVWNEEVNLGLLLSSTEIKITIWDYDIGLEFKDDFLERTTMNVPFCSTFNASTVTVTCDHPFGCESEDSLWKMPSRKLCSESGVIDFGGGAKLYLDFNIVPFQMEIELTNDEVLTSTPKLSVAARQQDPLAPWTVDNKFGYPFIGDSTNKLKFTTTNSESTYVEGALMFRMSNSDRGNGVVDEPLFYASVNFPAYIYVCRYYEDNTNGVPNWILNNYNAVNKSATRLTTDFSNYYNCYYQSVDGTIKNKWGGVKSGYLTFSSNVIENHENTLSYYSKMYIILALPRVDDLQNNSVVLSYDHIGLLQYFGEFGLIWLWFLYLIARFIKNKLNYRIDRIMTFLVTRVYTGKEKTVLATLLMVDGLSPSNILFRSNLYHVTLIIRFLLSVPLLLLIGWGFACVVALHPQAFGFAIAFLGIACLFLWYAVGLWEKQKWQMSPITLGALSCSVIFCLMFFVSVVFADPAVVGYNYPLDFTALSLVCGTINTFPLLVLVFQQDRTYKINLKLVIDSLIEAVQNKKQVSEAAIKNKKFSTNKAIHALLGDAYTINPKVPLFRYATVLADLSNESNANKANNGVYLYRTSLFILFVYLMIAVSRTNFPSLGFLHCLALILFDNIHSSLASGDVKWSPGYHTMILVAGRLSITSSAGKYWLLSYTAAFLIYSFPLLREIIDHSLPMLNKRQAGEVAFIGKDISGAGNPNLTGSPLFSLGSLFFFFISLILVAGFSESDALPLPKVYIWGMYWPMYVIGLIACLVIIISGLSMATLRAFYLDKNGLLRGKARDCYFLNPSVRLPMILAMLLELSIIAAGILIYACTTSKAVLVLAIFVPIIVILLSYAARVWLSNDFVLVHWPPRDDTAVIVNDTPSDLEVAFNMIGNLFGDDRHALEEEEEEPESADVLMKRDKKRTMKGFTLPPLQVTGNKLDGPIKMPPLPLKSILRRKREKMGIKATNPLVSDLKGRDDADADKFGNDDVIDSFDPWAQFDVDEVVHNEKDDTESDKKLNKSNASGSQRKGFIENPTIKSCFSCLTENRVFRFLQYRLRLCWRCCRSSLSRYEKISPRPEELDLEALDSNKDTADNGKTSGGSPEINSTGESGEAATPNSQRNNDTVPVAEAVDFEKMSFIAAVLGGYLTVTEYKALFAWFGGMFFIMLLGITLSQTVSPLWMGPVVWVACWTAICTVIPVVKYFNTYIIDNSIISFAVFVTLLHFLFCVCFFAVALKADIGNPPSLWIFDYFLYYPIFLYLLIQLYLWRDNNWMIVALDKDGDGSITWREYFSFFRGYPVILMLIIFLNFQFYVWISTTFGVIWTLGTLVAVIGYVFARDWSANQFFISPEFKLFGDTILKIILVISLLVSLGLTTAPVFPLSVFFFTLIFRCFTRIFARAVIADKDTMLFCSPFVMPIYSYDPRTNDVVDETQVAKQLFIALFAGVLWGATMAIFLYPVSVGISLACLFLLLVASMVAAAISYVPLRLGKYATMLTITGIKEAAESAVMKFEERKSPLDIEIPDWDNDDVSSLGGIGFDGTKSSNAAARSKSARTAIEIASDTIEDIHSLKYVKLDAQQVSMTAGAEVVANETTTTTATTASGCCCGYWSVLKKHVKKIFELIPSGQPKGWSRHNEALFNFTDAAAEVIITGRGPFGFLGAQGMWFKLFTAAQSNPRLSFLRQPWLGNYDSLGNRVNATTLSESMNCAGLLSRLTSADEALDERFHEENRSGIHFLLMLLVAADAKLQREQILFQKFLRENRFRLASNGISPPSDIFTSSSFASIDIPLVAVWLSRLSSEERERFHQLKATFTEEQRLRDVSTDAEDNQLLADANALAMSRIPREKSMVDKIRRDFAKSQTERVKAFANTLGQLERLRFDVVREIWTNNSDASIDPSDQDLYDKFRSAVMQDVDEVTEYARQVLSEVEAAQRDCRIGEYGRTYQFVDPEFAPGDASIGDCLARSSILGWRCAPGISENCQLFDGGTHPDDVEEGIFEDSWLMSAISMVASGSGLKEGNIDDHILSLFIGHYGIDGELAYSTEVGCFGLRLYKQGIWNPVIIDDIFPMLKQDKWTNENRGIAGAHSRECGEFWVSLIEKAYAKYYGSYASLSHGYVHHALQDLTGAESECIPISNASRGPGKRSLWDMLMRYRSNGFILGAGTGDSAQADKEVKEMGIIFNAAYTIFDVRQIDNFKLLKLRNPPGDHEEWKGDWSDASPLWTARLKKKLGWTDANDNTFWMSFDDFCNVFRFLYACKWYSNGKWTEIKLSGQWKAVTNSRRPTMESPAAATTPANSNGTPSNTNTNSAKPVEAVPAHTAGGLPSKHNPSCRLENNPHYKLLVHRPTEVRITLSQTDSRGVAKTEVVPAAIYICRNSHPTTPMRIKSLTRDNVVCYSGLARKERTQFLYATLMPGLYSVVTAAYLARMEGIFTISLLSNYKVDFAQTWPALWQDSKSKRLSERMKDDERSMNLNTLFGKGLTALVGTGKDAEGAKEEEGDNVLEDDIEKGNKRKI